MKTFLLSAFIALFTALAAHAESGTQYKNGYAIFRWETTYNDQDNGGYQHNFVITSLVKHLHVYNVSCNESNRDGWAQINGRGGQYTIHSYDNTYGQFWRWDYTYNDN